MMRLWVVAHLCFMLQLLIFPSESKIQTGHHVLPQVVNSNDTRDEKFFSLFTIVRFNNDGCVGNNNRNGTCLTSAECTQKSGTAAGTCASGFGVCCTIVATCGGTYSTNCTYIVGDSNTATPCVINICKCNNDICLLHFQFNTFQIAGPVSPGTTAATAVTGPQYTDCATDQFSITNPGGTGTPVICGQNPGQHMYVDASNQCNQAAFTLDSGATPAPTRMWDIKVNQISCNDPNRPPSGCLQYFTGTTGVIKSFNLEGGAQLGSQMYSICMRMERGFCSIGYALAPAPLNMFALSGTAPGLVGDANCATDYIILEGSTPVRYCGGTLIGVLPTTLTPKPFKVGVVFDDGEANTETSRTGFGLTYTQTACTG